MAKRLKAFHIENTRHSDTDAGWDIYLFADGSPTGTMVWFFYDFGGSLGHIEAEEGNLDLDDVFTDREIDRLWDGDFRKIVPPQGVRHRVLNDDQFHSGRPIDIVRQGLGLAA
jgi:hypothetical protein